MRKKKRHVDAGRSVLGMWFCFPGGGGDCSGSIGREGWERVFQNGSLRMFGRRL